MYDTNGMSSDKKMDGERDKVLYLQTSHCHRKPGNG